MIHGFGRVFRATPRPGVVRWDSADEILNLFGYEIDIDQYCHSLHKTLLELEKFVLDDILLGVYASIEDLEEKHQIQGIKDNGDETTPGFGIIAQANVKLKGLTNKESEEWFINVPQGKLGPHSSPEEIYSWLLNIHKAYSNLFVLLYATSYSGRGSEFEKARPINIGTQSRRNVVYDQEAHTGAIDSDYHKGFSITGLAKHNRRYMPYSVFRLLYVLVRIVRPIELALMLHINPNASPHIREGYAEAYTTRLFVSLGQYWTPHTMTASLVKWFQENLNLPNFGLHDIRHLAIALQAKFVDLNMPVNDIEKMNNQLVGHSTEVANAHYSRETYLGSCPRIERQTSLYLARQYHKKLGFATGSNEQDPPALFALRKNFNLSPPDKKSSSHTIISGVHIRNGFKGVPKKKGRARASRKDSEEPTPPHPKRPTREIKKQPRYTYDDEEEDEEEGGFGMESESDIDDIETGKDSEPDEEAASTSNIIMTRHSERVKVRKEKGKKAESLAAGSGKKSGARRK